MSKKDYYILSIDKRKKGAKTSPLDSYFKNTDDTFIVMIQSRKELSDLYSLLGDSYSVEQIQKSPAPIKTFEQFRKELIDGEDNKPRGLEFGEEE